ncbi:MAG: hypothetical protein ACLFPS_05820 [Clostridia bacterium]
MKFKKINWNSGEVIAKIKLQEANGIGLGEWTVAASELGKFAKMVREKFGKKVDRDLDWLR